jgi:hypothetical protein
MTWTTDYGRTRLREAQEAIARVEPMLRRGERAEAEKAARASLGVFRSAMDWLEDSTEFEHAHRLIDLAGAYVRRTFGCRLHRDGKTYAQRCPVALAHNRVGMSATYVVLEAECSICHEDPATCSHITGRVYDGERCHRIVVKADLLEASFVRRPRLPDARITSVSLDVDQLQDKLGPSWSPGLPVSCDRCLESCDGVHEAPEVLTAS